MFFFALVGCTCTRASRSSEDGTFPHQTQATLRYVIGPRANSRQHCWVRVWGKAMSAQEMTAKATWWHFELSSNQTSTPKGKKEPKRNADAISAKEKNMRFMWIEHMTFR